MAPFRFRLEQVLAYRRQLEEQAMQELAKARALRDETARRIAHMEADLAETREKLGQAVNLPAEERWLLTGYEKALITELDAAKELLAQQEEAVDACRAVLVQKAQERELLDKLKEKQANRHAQEERLKEQRENDEIATLRYQPAAL